MLEAASAVYPAKQTFDGIPGDGIQPRGLLIVWKKQI